MNEQLIEILKEEVKKRCDSEDNYFGVGAYHHIEAVAKNAIFLANEYKADVEVVAIAGWLHDIASVTNFSLYKEHHIHGAEIAKEILTKLNYDKDKIELVKKCILNHRGSIQKEKNSIEEIIIADADAISHFDSLPSLFYLAYVQRKMTIPEGADFVKNKLQRSYKKLSAKNKEIYKEKYDKVMSIFD